MTGAQNRLIHELIEQSHDRVCHVRAGHSLVAVLDEQTSKLNGPPAAAVALARTRRTQMVNLSHNKSRRKRGVVVASLQDLPAATSFQQYASYAGSKLVEKQTLTMGSRRKAVPLIPTDKLPEIPAKAAGESPTSKLLRAVAVMKTQHAFLKSKQHDVPRLETPKNSHMAFLEFRRESTSSEKAKSRATVTADVTRMNAVTREPLRFGDAVCFISQASNLPLAVGPNGRTVRVDDAVTGPHMIFRIVDFHNLQRHDDVLLGEDFWLRVDESYLQVDDVDEILSLVVDTHYYLGCPGWVEDEEGGASTLPVIGSATKYVKKDREHARAFKLVAMKAMVPANSYYGDDRATREFTLETNQSISRLATWRFKPAKADEGCESAALLLNCSLVVLQQGECPLEFDPRRRRGVLRDDVKHGDYEALGHHQRESCTWQVRLVRRDAAQAEVALAKKAPRSPERRPHHQSSEKESLEWLQHHHELVLAEQKRLTERLRLAEDAKRAFDRVAVKSNNALALIELNKTLDQHAYFQNRYTEVLKGGNIRLPAL